MRSSRPNSGGERQPEPLRALPDGSARFSRRVLVIAFVISLVIHAIMASGVRYDLFTPKDSDVEKVTLEHKPPVLRIARKTPPPSTPTPPPQTPAPTPQPTTAPAAAPSVAPRPHSSSGTNSITAASQGTGGKGASPATTAPLTTPTPLPPVTGACPNPQATPGLAASPPPVDLDVDVRRAAVNAVAKIRVDVDAQGNVTGVGMEVSSGNASADAALLAMARGARYTPAFKDCKATAGQYIMAVRLAPW